MMSNPIRLYGEIAQRNMEIAIYVLQETGIGIADCQLGGGTSLAARWRHRHSTDVDIFASWEALMQGIDALGGEETNHPKLRSILRAAGKHSILEAHVLPYGIMWKAEDQTEGSIFPARLQNPGPNAAHESRSEMILEEPASILQSKVVSRMNDSFSFMDRDAYDLITATEKDKESLFAAFDSKETPQETLTICKKASERIQHYLSEDPGWAGTPEPGNRPLINPHRKDLHGRKLWEETRKLLAHGPREYVRKLRPQ